MIPTGKDVSVLPRTYGEVIPVSYLDRMGHMNVMWYTHLFGAAVRDFYDLIGLTDRYMRDNHVGVFALEAHIRYVSEVKAGQAVTVRTRALARTEKRMHYMHFLVIDESDKLSAFCEFVAAHIDMKIRRQSPILEPVASAFDRIVAEHRGLGWDPPVCGAMAP